MELFVAPLRDFRAGVLTNVRGCYDYWSLPTGKKYTTNGLKSLVISIMVTCLVTSLILIPIHVLFYLIRLILFFSNRQWMQAVEGVHRHINFSNLLFDACWYLPLIILFLARNLGLFSSLPFHNHLASYPQLAEALKRLPVNWTERYRSWLKSSLKSIGKLVMLSAVVFLLKMGFKRLQHALSVLTVLYGQYVKYYKKVTAFADPKYEGGGWQSLLSKKNLLLLLANLVVAYLIFDNVGLATAFLRFYEWYIAATALSIELLYEYTARLSYRQEKIFAYKNGWFLFGYGSVILLSFYVPFLGLVMYHSFQYASVGLLVQMLSREKQLSQQGKAREPKMLLWDAI